MDKQNPWLLLTRYFAAAVGSPSEAATMYCYTYGTDTNVGTIIKGIRMTEKLKFYSEYGYRRDMESQNREIGSGRADSTATQTANQIKHLKSALKELVSIVEIHSNATKNNFAWAELYEAKAALDV